LPEDLILENGSEFAGHGLDAWAFQQGMTLHFPQTGGVGPPMIADGRSKALAEL